MIPPLFDANSLDTKMSHLNKNINRIAILAGSGDFPFLVAREAKRQGIETVALGIRGWVDSKLSEQVDSYEEVAIGELSRLIECIKLHNVSHAIMAGKVTKDILFEQRASFDAEMRNLISQVTEFSVNSLLGAIANRLAKEGVTFVDSATFLKSSLCPAKVLTARAPNEKEKKDITVGLKAARKIAECDIGQTIVVKSGVVVAVEALEGTDKAIRRAYELAGKGLTVIKVASPHQDRRFDLPVIGSNTIKTLVESGVSCMALEAGSALLLDREILIQSADQADICLLGVDVSSSAF